MPNYMLLLYAPEADAAEQTAREAEWPLWRELNDSLTEAGLVVGGGRLRPVASATTVRVRGGEAELTDGPFALTKEVLIGYYVLQCRDLDEALAQAARIPLAGYRDGAVEVRPIMDTGEVEALHEAAVGRA